MKKGWLPTALLTAVLAVSAVAAEKPAAKGNFTVSASRDWLPVAFEGGIVPGSPLDFSCADKPAGKYGFVTLSGRGHLIWEKKPQTRVRFFGPNLVKSANIGTHAQTDVLVADLVKMGYNMARLHHFESWIQDSKALSSLEFDAEKLDRFFYLIAKLKENGLYISLDLYASRPLHRGDNFPEFKDYDFSGKQEMKPLILVSPAAMANWKAYSRKLLSLKNPYTGLPLLEDPVLWSVNMVNENPVLAIWARVPHLVPLFEKKYVEYLQKNHLDTPENRRDRTVLFRNYLLELQKKCLDEQIAFLRNDLKCRFLITDLNMWSAFPLTELRDKLDLVDNHQYWDHPKFPEVRFELPHLYKQISALECHGGLPREMMGARVFGKPYMISEYNFVNPNVYRVEAAPLIGGYAALQDWDVLNRFAWSHFAEKIGVPGAPTGFDAINDPQARLTELITHALFVRGDVAPAQEAYAAAYQDKHRKQGGFSYDLPGEFQKLGLFARIGSVMADKNVNGVKNLDPFEKNWRQEISPAAQEALDNLQKTGRITSSTGEIQLDAKAKTMCILTPKSEVFSFTGAAAGDIAAFKNGKVFQTVAVISRDNLPLTQSRSILLIHLTNQLAAGQTFADADLTKLLSFGQLPLLLQRSAIEAELRLPAGFTLHALTLSGRDNGVIPTVYRDGKYSFIMDNAAKPGTVQVYHLTR